MKWAPIVLFCLVSAIAIGGATLTIATLHQGKTTSNTLGPGFIEGSPREFELPTSDANTWTLMKHGHLIDAFVDRNLFKTKFSSQTFARVRIKNKTRTPIGISEDSGLFIPLVVNPHDASIYPEPALGYLSAKDLSSRYWEGKLRMIQPLSEFIYYAPFARLYISKQPKLVRFRMPGSCYACNGKQAELLSTQYDDTKPFEPAVFEIEQSLATIKPLPVAANVLQQDSVLQFAELRRRAITEKLEEESDRETEKLIKWIRHERPIAYSCCLSLAALHLRMRKYDLALIDCDRGLALSPGQEQLMVMKARLHALSGSFKQAATEFAAIKYMSTGDYSDRAYAALGLRNMDQALEDCNRDIAYETKYPDIHTNGHLIRAMIHLASGRYQDCLRDCNEGLINKTSNGRTDSTYESDYSWDSAEELRRETNGQILYVQARAQQKLGNDVAAGISRARALELGFDPRMDAAAVVGL